MSELDVAEDVVPYDEAVTGTGRLRTHWQTLIGLLGPIGPERMGELRDEAVRLLRQNGVTYTFYGDLGAGERQWPIDIVPLLISDEEWHEIESGVRQRAHLLNEVLADLYGPQRMVEQGVLPPVLLEANPSFQRDCHGISPPNGTYLHLLAIDLVRGESGRWHVLGDRTEAPSGAGYALENRDVVGRILRDSMAECRTRPLTPFFSALRDGLAAVAPPNMRPGRKPRIVLMTPGPYNETYFEHVYLTRQLGLTLVEGADLTVRDRRVYLKTVTALEPVDVIWRRVDDDFCDPLEMRADSQLGVPGLMEAVRAGNVTVGNALGSGLLQTLAFKPYMAELCRTLLGEEPKLEDVPSWWCGIPEQRDHVLRNLDRLVIKPALVGQEVEPIFADELTPALRADLARRISANPREFVGQTRLRFSQTPTWVAGELHPRPFILRVYAAAGRDGFTVMPGGLTRFAPNLQRTMISIRGGGGSKDSWVLGSGQGRLALPSVPRPQDNVVPISEAISHRAHGGELPSRAADGLFWLGRYAERTDGTVRLLRTLILGLSDSARPVQDLQPLLDLMRWLALTPPLRAGQQSQAEIAARVIAMIRDPTHPNGIASTLSRLVRVAGGLRDHLPLDSWNAVVDYARPPQLEDLANNVEILLMLNQLVTLGSALSGAIDDTMPRNAGWRFLEIGKRLERAIRLVSIIRGCTSGAPPHDPHEQRDQERRVLDAILALTGARPAIGPQGDLSRADVLEAALTSRFDPRGLAFQLVALVEHLAGLPQPGPFSQVDQGMLLRARQIAGGGLAVMRDSIVAGSASRWRGAFAETADPLHAAFIRLENQLSEVSSLLTQLYFAHAFARRA